MSSRDPNKIQSSPRLSVTDSPPSDEGLPRSTRVAVPRSKSNLTIPLTDPGAEKGPPKRPSANPLISRPPRRKSIHISSVGWGKEANFDNGRVLIIEYRLNDAKNPVIAHREITNVHSLERFYTLCQKRPHRVALRVIHVQNAPWATPFLLRKYNIIHTDDLVGTNFGKWVWSAVPELRGGKPWLKSRSWRCQQDPWRSVRRTQFNVDYYKEYKGPTANEAYPIQDQSLMTMELNRFDDDGALTTPNMVFAQRLSVYIQHADSEIPTPPSDVTSPYLQPPNGSGNVGSTKGATRAQNIARSRMPKLEDLDNGSTVILWEKSASGSVQDTLLTARDQIESRWRRLSFFLPREDINSEDRLALQGINHIVSDIFRGVTYNWERFLATGETHVSALEDKIYESPADETRAPELWLNSSHWLKVEKVCSNHVDVVREMKLRLSDLSEDDSVDVKWLDGISEEFDKVANLIQEDLVKPTANLNDLLYKSVGIRDSRHGLQLNISLWRLSWITFIFLPLTFVVGFFGMNVSTFKGDPSIRWYFLAAVLLMLVVVALWYLFKHLMQARRYTPYQRGVYEHLYDDLTTSRPELWSRRGARPNVQPVGTIDRLKWRLLKYWFTPEKTIAKSHGDPDEDAGGSGLGAWDRIKRKLARHWLSKMVVDESTSIDTEELALAERVEVEGGVLKALAGTSTLAATAEAIPMEFTASAPFPVTRYNLQQLSPPVSPPLRGGSSGSAARASSSGGGSSDGMILEERDFDDKEDEDAPWTRSWRPSIDAIVGSVSDHHSHD